MLTFVEKAEKAFDEQRTKELAKKVRATGFDLDDFLSQLREVKKMGSIAQLAEMVPGLSHLTRRLPAGADETQLKKVEAIILSMTPAERHNPAIIDGSRRRRIARGSGTRAQDINQLLNQFRQMQKLMKMGIGGKLPKNLGGIFG